MKKVLFVSHEASQTGAPVCMLDFLSWFKKNKSIPFEILIVDSNEKKGALLSSFADLAPTHTLDSIGWWSKTLNRAGRVINKSNSVVSNDLRRCLRECSLLYANSIGSVGALEKLKIPRIPTVVHVHEQEFAIQNWIGINRFNWLISRAQKIIVSSRIVLENLTSRHNLPPENIVLAPYWIPRIWESKKSSTESIRRQLGLSPTDMVVGAVGTSDLRKGPDFFLQMAFQILIHCKNINVHFVWMGEIWEGASRRWLQHDIDNSILKGKVHFIGAKSNPMDYMSIFDVLTILSREEPFGIVCLEAASLSIPTVCFDSVGAADFVGEDCGLVSNYLNIPQVANQVLELLNDEPLRVSLGTNAFKKVENCFQVENSAPIISSVIEEQLFKN